MYCQSFGDPLPGNASRLGKLVQAVRTRIDVVELELIGRRVLAGVVVDPIEALHVLDVDGRSRRRKGGR